MNDTMNDRMHVIHDRMHLLNDRMHLLNDRVHVLNDRVHVMNDVVLQVVMSHGQYSSALDMWSLGCVFGELLQRVTYPGKAATPHLQVAPVIAVTGFPATPKTGDHFNGPGNETTCKVCQLGMVDISQALLPHPIRASVRQSTCSGTHLVCFLIRDCQQIVE